MQIIFLKSAFIVRKYIYCFHSKKTTLPSIPTVITAPKTTARSCHKPYGNNSTTMGSLSRIPSKIQRVETPATWIRRRATRATRRFRCQNAAYRSGWIATSNPSPPGTIWNCPSTIRSFSTRFANSTTASSTKGQRTRRHGLASHSVLLKSRIRRCTGTGAKAPWTGSTLL